MNKASQIAQLISWGRNDVVSKWGKAASLRSYSPTSDIKGAFVWAASEEGPQYWDRVNKALKRRDKTYLPAIDSKLSKRWK